MIHADFLWYSLTTNVLNLTDTNNLHNHSESVNISSWICIYWLLCIKQWQGPVEMLITTTQTLGTGDTSTGETTEGMQGDTGAISGKHEPLASIGGELCSVEMFVYSSSCWFWKKKLTFVLLLNWTVYFQIQCWNEAEFWTVE